MSDAIENDSEEGTALLIPETMDVAAFFAKTEAVDTVLAKIEEEVRSHKPDLSTAKGRKAIASLAARVSKAKTFLDNAGKALNETAREQINAVDKERRRIRERLDGLRDEARDPLTKWELAEEARVQAIKDRLDQLAVDVVPPDAPSAVVRAALDAIFGTPIDESWAEFTAQAAMRKDNAVRMLRARLASAEKREADAAELEKLRAEKAARDAQEAAERAEREAKERAEREAREAAERQARIEREKQEAAERAAAAERERAEREQKEAAERHARELAEAERRAEAEKEAIRRKMEADAKAAKEREEAEARAAEEKRQAQLRDEKIRREAYERIMRQIMPMSHQMIARALIDGKVPHMRFEP